MSLSILVSRGQVTEKTVSCDPSPQGKEMTAKFSSLHARVNVTQFSQPFLHDEVTGPKILFQPFHRISSL